jgi:hypothetical protein
MEDDGTGFLQPIEPPTLSAIADFQAYSLKARRFAVSIDKKAVRLTDLYYVGDCTLLSGQGTTYIVRYAKLFEINMRLFPGYKYAGRHPVGSTAVGRKSSSRQGKRSKNQRGTESALGSKWPTRGFDNARRLVWQSEKNPSLLASATSLERISAIPRHPRSQRQDNTLACFWSSPRWSKRLALFSPQV